MTAGAVLAGQGRTAAAFRGPDVPAHVWFGSVIRGGSNHTWDNPRMAQTAVSIKLKPAAAIARKVDCNCAIIFDHNLV
jgi:hypothetical protein